MPNTSSAEKQARVTLRRQKINTKLQTRSKTTEKKARALSPSSKAEEKKSALAQLQSAVDRAAKKNAMHPNKASRIKSRVARLLQKAK